MKVGLFLFEYESFSSPLMLSYEVSSKAKLQKWRLFISFFFFPRRGAQSQEFLAKTGETWDKNRHDFHCMQVSLVMSMRFIFGDDSNNAPCSIVPVRAVKLNLRRGRNCVRYLLSRRCYDKEEFVPDRSQGYFNMVLYFSLRS